jgi:[acyl-carrier-protein] S-malonyltransferase
MFSVIFPGQGSQMVGMTSDLYSKFDLFKKLYKEADEVLNFPISKLILEGPKDQLDLTENTQPAIFLVGYSIFQIIKEEFKIDLNNAKFFAGHSLGEYTALACSGALSFVDTLKILKIRGNAMQSAVPKGKGGMLAIMGSDSEIIEKIFEENKDKYECFIANDNSNGQLVVSGSSENINKLSLDLASKKIKNIKLSVSAPFHCKLMSKATQIMKKEITKLEFKDFKNSLISNVTAKEIGDKNILKDLLIKQIESRVRWRESVQYMVNNGVNKFIEIGPGKVLSGLIKRIHRDVKVSAINNEEDISVININD